MRGQMMPGNALSVQGTQEIERTEAPSLDAFIMRACSDPAFDVEKLERLLALKERSDAQQRKVMFDCAVARVQALMPRIDKNGLIDYGSNKAKIPYAKLEDVDEAIRHIYQAEGFSVKWDTPLLMDGKMVRVVGHFRCHGHEETSEMTFPPDKSGGKNDSQAVASSANYGKRLISINFWNLICVDSDKDGAHRKELEKITQDQADDLRSKVAEVKGNMVGLLKLLRVSSVEEIRVGQLTEAYNVIESKRRG